MLQTTTSILPFLLSACKMFRLHYETEIISNQQKNGGTSNNTPPLSLPTTTLLNEWIALDSNLTVNLSSHVTRRASSLQGSGIFRAFGQMFPSINPAIKLLKRRVLKLMSSKSNEDEYRGHAATCFGAVCGLLGMDDKSCASMFLYTTARDMINAAVRMNIVGPLVGGRLTNEICVRLEDWIVTRHFGKEEGEEERSRCLYDTEANHQVAPLVEILASVQDRLYTRLFNS
mmetsp:Transcript_37563/g.57250  ORF Transcript_37563/g.57250 Transcript_37563/m.57250 type:complete len:230 (+) Transcript_37563:348-1037(+)